MTKKHSTSKEDFINSSDDDYEDDDYEDDDDDITTISDDENIDEFEEYFEDNEEKNEDEEQEDEEQEDEEQEDEEQEDEEQEDEEEQEEETYDDFDDNFQDDVDESMILLDDEPNVKSKRKKEYEVKISDVTTKLYDCNYSKMEYKEFEKCVKDDMYKYILVKGQPSEKNINILYKNILCCVFCELNIPLNLSGVNDEKELSDIVQELNNPNHGFGNRDSVPCIKLIHLKKRILDKIRFIYYYKNECSVKDIQSLIKTKEMWGKIKHSGSSFSTNIWDEFRENIKKDVIKLKSPVEVIEGMYTCPKCNCNLTQSYNVQLRRADEPMTTFITCMNKNCKNKWRKG